MLGGLGALALFAAVALVLAGPAAAETAGLIRHGARTEPKVALTFDLCQVPQRPAGFDGDLVRFLEEEAVPATFFLGGDWMRTHPEETRRLAANPRFELGNHSWSHPDFRQLSPAEMIDQVRRTDDILGRLTGRHSTLLRLPYGGFDDKVLATLTGQGWRVIQWDVETGDPDPQVSAAAIVATVSRQASNGSIVIMHANGRGRHTAEALPQVVRELRRRGFDLLTVSELLALPGAD